MKQKFPKILVFVLCFFLLFYGSFIDKNIHAQDYYRNNVVQKGSPEYQAVVDALANSECPDVIKNTYLIKNSAGQYELQEGVNVALKGSLIYGYNLDSNGRPANPILISCASATTIEKLIVRLIMLLFSIVGLVLAFAIGKSSVKMITSMGNPEKFKEAVKGFVNPIIYTFGLLFAYTILVFVLVGVMGFGVVKNENRKEYNLFCQQRIIFNLTFDKNEPCD